MNEKETSQNQVFSHDLQYLCNQAQIYIDELAVQYCREELHSENYEHFKNMSPNERIQLFIDLRTYAENAKLDKNFEGFPPHSPSSMDLCHTLAKDPQALIGNTNVQNDLIDDLHACGYSEINFIEREDMERRIEVAPIIDRTGGGVIKGKFLFWRDRVLLRCHQDGREPDYVIKRSYFIGDENFVEELNIDPYIPGISDVKTLQCEQILDESDTIAIPHSVLYYVKSGYPDNIHPVYTNEKAKLATNAKNGYKEKQNKLSVNQTEQTLVNTLFVGGGVDDRDFV